MVKYSYVIKGCVKLYDDSSHAHIKLSHWCYSNGYVIGKLFKKILDNMAVVILAQLIVSEF